MSTWKDIPKENIELYGNELNVCIGSDDMGNNYVVLKVTDVSDLLLKAQKPGVGHIEAQSEATTKEGKDV